MVGYFERGHLYTEFEVYGVFTQNKKQVKAQVDTGYSGYLTLQYIDAFPLGLVLIGTKAYTIADGSTMYNFVALGTVSIDGKEIMIPIDIQPKDSILVGMQLLKKIEKDLVGTDVALYEDCRELLGRPEIVAVGINTPPNIHFQLAMDALNAGKHVLVEKPPALTVEECEQMIDVANKKGKVLFMAFHARYNPSVEVAKRELSNKKIASVDIKYAEYALNYHHPNGWIFNPDIAGGGVLMDSGINALSIVTSVLPNIDLEPTNAHFEQPENFKVETRAEVDFKFGQNGKGHLSMDWMHKGQEIRQITFGTDEGSQYMVDIVSNSFLKNGTPVSRIGESREMVDQHSEYRRVYADFARCIAQRISLTSTKELIFIKKAYQIAGR